MPNTPTIDDPAQSSLAPALEPTDRFAPRHLGPTTADIERMLSVVGAPTLDALIDETIPASIRMDHPFELCDLPAQGLGESAALARLAALARQNEVYRSCIGMGYAGTLVPPVIQRNVLEDPCWYTQYTPYQAEIAQGRLEALLNFQTMIADLTRLPIANASLLDEATAAAEAMTMCVAIASGQRRSFFVADHCHPQTIAVVQTRGSTMGVRIEVGPIDTYDPADRNDAGVLVQDPATDGAITDHDDLCARAHRAGTLVVAATDPLALTLLRPPGDWGADIAIGSAQRLGVPMGFGGPHAGYIATREQFVRKMPGRIIGVSRDAHGAPAYRMAIQTREQHIKRDRATSNICTAQALLAIMAGFYGVYHGPKGLHAIASRVRTLTQTLAKGLAKQGHTIEHDLFFDTIRVRVQGNPATVLDGARLRKINLRDFADGSLGITLDETSDRQLVLDLLASFGGTGTEDLDALACDAPPLPTPLARTSDYMTHPVFNTHHSETQMLRYITHLASRDLSLAHSMIPLGSCTMKLNATSEMLPVSWPQLADIHPFAPADQTRGYRALFAELASWLGTITGLPGVSLQPNAGAQGEYSGLGIIRAYHAAHSQGDRDVCLIPTSAHGTNPASAVMAGLRVVAVQCDESGAIDLDDLQDKAAAHADRLAAIMVTYPSTFGVFDQTIAQLCQIVHDHGGQVYLDGANMNAQVGLCRPGDYGADVCHLNLHKTFAIPHGGGGPGVGPICCADHLTPYLPTHPVVDPTTGKPDDGAGSGFGTVAAAPWGSAGILAIPWMYIAMLGADGCAKASRIAILNANYMAARLGEHYPVLYRGPTGRVAHEFILDCRPFDKDAAIKIDDIAKRLMDFGFHAPTMAWPVPGTLMIEPTESEPLEELDRYCDALIAIRAEIDAITRGELDKQDNPLTGAPHTIAQVSRDDWPHPYTRSRAAFPAPWLTRAKFWPCVGRIDNPFGDRNLMCTCPSMDELESGKKA